MLEKNKPKSFRKLSLKERYEIGKYASVSGNSAAIKHFKFKNLSESTVRTFKSKYHIEIRQATKEKRSPKKVLELKKQGRPLLLREIDLKYQKFLKVARSRGAVINTSIAIATANGFIEHSNDKSLKHLSLERPWAQSLFPRMGYVRRFPTTGKVKLPQGVKREAELLYIHNILNLIETPKIPKSMALNLDQTPVKYVPCGKTTLAKQNTSSVPVSGVSDKLIITASFTIILEEKFLPIQLIYGGKTRKNIPTVKFLRGFLLSANPKHYSNEEETPKLLKEVIILYIQNERKTFRLDADYPALLIMDMFKVQMTPAVLNMLKTNNIFLTKVPANMTKLYQPLDLTVNGYAKSFMKKKKKKENVYGMVHFKNLRGS